MGRHPVNAGSGANWGEDYGGDSECERPRFRVFRVFRVQGLGFRV